MNFRKDINGLRAVAVMVVVLFHFGVYGMEGGFVGVDIFFVISGFLMTGIIFSRVEQGNFSLWGFYLDRARRIVPALAFVCLVVLGGGWFLLLPANYETLGRHVLSALGFVSNFIFWDEVGYFEQAAHDKWLLHTWSLSVEWQFYLLYPLLVMLLRKLASTEQSRRVILAFALLSFLVSVFGSGRWPTPAFYLLPTRAWEMLVGALVYLYPLHLGRRSRKLLELTGFALIAYGLFRFSEHHVWPGRLAAVPVLGAAFIIAASRRRSLLTGNSLSQFLGRTSYSIYLWHWPVAVWLNYFGLAGQPLWMAGGIAFSILLGWCSFVFIEGIARKGTGSQPAWARPQLRLASVFASACVFGVVVLMAEGFPKRFDEKLREATRELVMPSVENGWCFYDVENLSELPIGKEGLRCLLGDRESSLKGLLFGDSFAGHYGPFWDDIGKHAAAQVNSIATNWCYPSVTKEFTGTAGRGYDQCLVNRDYLLKNLAKYDFVVFSGAWGNVYRQDKLQGVLDAISLAAEKTGLVVVMAAPTTFDVNVRNMYERSLLFDLEFDISRYGTRKDANAREANARIEAFARQFPNVLFIGRESLFHVDGVPSEVTRENIPFSLDQFGHISLYGSKKAAEAFKGSGTFREFKERVARIREMDARGRLLSPNF